MGCGTWPAQEVVWVEVLVSSARRHQVNVGLYHWFKNHIVGAHSNRDRVRFIAVRCHYTRVQYVNAVSLLEINDALSVLLHLNQVDL